jgi:hypothetical protein
MARSSALGGFATACLLFAGAFAGPPAGLPYYGPDLIAGPFALMAMVFLLGACAGLLALLATVLGACSFRSAWGKVGALGGPALLVGVPTYLLWAFSLS